MSSHNRHMQLNYFLQGKMGNTRREITAWGPVSKNDEAIQIIFLFKVRQLRARERILLFSALTLFGSAVDKV